MRRARRSLRVRLAVLGFGAIYVPALLLFGVAVATDTEITSTADHETMQVETSRQFSPWITGTVLALAPVAAGAAWWWAGRAVRPIHRIQTVAEEIQGTDLSRRIGLDRGPAEVVALAASFDAMLDRLDRAGETQRRLIEEASHELRLPLSVLMTNAEVLLAHPDPTMNLYRRGLERSGRAAARLRTTIDDLLVEARGRARIIDRRPADLVAVVRGVVAEAAVLAATRQVEVSITGARTAVCPVDEPALARAVSNLVDNAIRYAPAGSTVEVGVEVTGSAAAVAVTDHGPGVPVDERDLVFQRFWRGPRRVGESGGAGLGLPIAQQIAAAHGGTLTVTSPGPAGDGCTFRLSLRR